MTTTNSPRTRWQSSGSGKPGQGGEPPRFSLGRIAAAIVFLVCPIGIILGSLLRVPVSRSKVWRKVRGDVVIGLAVLAAIALVATGAGHTYATMWRELAHAIQDSAGSVFPAVTEKAKAEHAAQPQLGSTLGQLIADRWSTWLWCQVPLSLCVAAAMVGWTMFRQRRYAPAWREETPARLDELSEKKRAAVAARDEKAVVKATAKEPSKDLRRLAMHIGVNNEAEPIRLTGEQFLAHLLLLGPTGAGKTSTMTRILHGWLVTWQTMRLSSVLLDFKGDPELVDQAAAMAAATGRRCYVARLDGETATINTLRHGTAPEVASRIVHMLDNTEGMEFENNYYRGKGTEWLIGAVTALDELIKQKCEWTAPDVPDGRTRRWRRDIADLGALMSVPNMRAELPNLKGRAERQVRELLAEFDPNPPKSTAQAMQDVGGMVTAVRLLAKTGTADLLIEDGELDIDLEDVIRCGDVVVFSLAAAGNSAAAQTVGNLVLQDLTATFARLEAARWTKTTGQRCLLLLDEFGALGGGLLVDLVERVRSAGGTVMVSAQDDADLESVSPEFRRKVLTNSLLHVLHQQYGESVETHAKAIGTREGWKETIQVTEDASLIGSEHLGSGVGSLRDVQQFIVSPNELRKLQPGEVILFSRRPWQVERVKITRAPELPAAVPEDRDVDQAPKNPAPTIDLSKPPVREVEHQDLAADEPPMVPELAYEAAGPSAPGGPDEPPEEHAW